MYVLISVLTNLWDVSPYLYKDHLELDQDEIEKPAGGIGPRGIGEALLKAQ